MPATTQAREGYGNPGRNGVVYAAAGACCSCNPPCTLRGCLPSRCLAAACIITEGDQPVKPVQQAFQAIAHALVQSMPGTAWSLQLSTAMLLGRKRGSATACAASGMSVRSAALLHLCLCRASFMASARRRNTSCPACTAAHARCTCCTQAQLHQPGLTTLTRDSSCHDSSHLDTSLVAVCFAHTGRWASGRLRSLLSPRLW